jgi:hypothetical protein
MDPSTNTESSAFFASLFAPTQTSYPATFSISFQGLGLPTPLYDAYVEFLLTVDENFRCDGLYSQCYLKGTNCSQL